MSNLFFIKTVENILRGGKKINGGGQMIWVMGKNQKERKKWNLNRLPEKKKKWKLKCTHLEDPWHEKKKTKK